MSAADGSLNLNKLKFSVRYLNQYFCDKFGRPANPPNLKMDAFRIPIPHTPIIIFHIGLIASPNK